ncbi:MAG: acyl carrier protein [Dehalococcoidia bacterium]|jgi:acyl carrier protein|nr:acyl carrier protein [Dehalococcoidia bacterium]
MTVEEQVKDIVSKIAHIDKAIMSREATFKEMKADSLDVVQALVAVEETFDIEIPDEEAQKFRNFGDFVSFVENAVSKKG